MQALGQHHSILRVQALVVALHPGGDLQRTGPKAWLEGCGARHPAAAPSKASSTRLPSQQCCSCPRAGSHSASGQRAGARARAHPEPPTLVEGNRLRVGAVHVQAGVRDGLVLLAGFQRPTQQLRACAAAGTSRQVGRCEGGGAAVVAGVPGGGGGAPPPPPGPSSSPMPLRRWGARTPRDTMYSRAVLSGCSQAGGWPRGVMGSSWRPTAAARTCTWRRQGAGASDQVQPCLAPAFPGAPPGRLPGHCHRMLQAAGGTWWRTLGGGGGGARELMRRHAGGRRPPRSRRPPASPSCVTSPQARACW